MLDFFAIVNYFYRIFVGLGVCKNFHPADDFSHSVIQIPKLLPFYKGGFNA